MRGFETLVVVSLAVGGAIRVISLAVPAPQPVVAEPTAEQACCQYHAAPASELVLVRSLHAAVSPHDAQPAIFKFRIRPGRRRRRRVGRGAWRAFCRGVGAGLSVGFCLGVPGEPGRHRFTGFRCLAGRLDRDRVRMVWRREQRHGIGEPDGGTARQHHLGSAARSPGDGGFRAEPVDRIAIAIATAVAPAS